MVKEIVEQKDLLMVSVGTNLDDSRKNIALAKKNTHVFASVGIHPSEIKPFTHIVGVQTVLEELVIKEKDNIVAVGEIGLDEKIENISSEDQEKYLDKFIDIAVANNIPIIIHARGKNAINKIIENIEKRKAQKEKLSGVFHCFIGNFKQAQKIINLGFYIGLTNIICNCKDFDKIISEIDINKILCETDAPFIPNKKTGRNYSLPSDVKFVYKKIAEIKNVKIEETKLIINQNSVNLFNFDR